MFREANFCAWLSEGGLVVPGSLRRGHNVFTDTGREWVKQLVVWDPLAIPFTGQFGAAANVIAGAPGGQKRVSGLTGMSAASVGRYLHIINSGDNDGSFLIVTFIDANTVDVVDASPGTIPDTNNGFIDWVETGGIGDTPVDGRRLRWIGVGDGYLSEITSVNGLAGPLTLATGPDEYIRQLGTKTSPTDYSVLYTTVFTGASADLDHHGTSVDVSEAGIFADVHDGVGTLLDPSLGTHAPVAYKSFAALTKLQAQTLTLTWEFRF